MHAYLSIKRNRFRSRSVQKSTKILALTSADVEANYETYLDAFTASSALARFNFVLLCWRDRGSSQRYFNKQFTRSYYFPRPTSQCLDLVVGYVYSSPRLTSYAASASTRSYIDGFLLTPPTQISSVGSTPYSLPPCFFVDRLSPKGKLPVDFNQYNKAAIEIGNIMRLENPDNPLSNPQLWRSSNTVNNILDSVPSLLSASTSYSLVDYIMIMKLQLGSRQILLEFTTLQRKPFQTHLFLLLKFGWHQLQSTLFAGGRVGGSEWKSDVAIFDINTRTFTAASLTAASNNTQAVSIDKFAIFVSGNVADFFDSNTMTWSTHTLSQSATSSFGFSIVKSQRYAFFVSSGRANVFDSNSGAWSTLIIDASTTASYCPVVGDYALFSCDTWVSIYNTANNNFVRRIEM